MIKTDTAITVTPQEISAAFTEWERRFRKTPEKFQSDMQRLANDPGKQGDLQARYFVEILENLSEPAV